MDETERRDAFKKSWEAGQGGTYFIRGGKLHLTQYMEKLS